MIEMSKIALYAGTDKICKMPPQRLDRTVPMFAMRNATLKQLMICIGVTSIVLTLTMMWNANFIGSQIYEPMIDLLINEQFLLPQFETEHFEEKNARHKMMQSNVTILGIGRDVGDNLEFVLQQIGYLEGLFRSSQFLFLDGNSTDTTRAVFRNWQNSYKGYSKLLVTTSPSLEIEGHFKNHPMPREGRLSDARNKGLEELSQWPKTDYIIMIDMDILGWETSGILHSFSLPDWDVICARGIVLNGVYRDTYAFRANGINTNHHWSGNDFAAYNLSETDLPLRRERLHATHMEVREMMSKAIGSGGHQPLVRVNSCFGGLAIYKSSVIKNCRYAYRYQEPPHMLDCEHVLFHQCLQEKNGEVRFFVNPNMKLWYGHGALKMPFSKLMGYVMGWLRTKLFLSSSASL